MSKCVIWEGVILKTGYGRTWYNGRSTTAHRAEYEKHHGPIPDGLVVRHACDNPACFNIEHLSLGTHSDNMRDMRERGRSAVGVRQHLAKLTDSDIRFVRESTLSSRAMAKQLGVGKSTITDIRSGKTWRHI